jgi:lipopolysaccharide export system permease protein
MTFFIVLFLLLIQFLFRYIDELVGKGLGIKIIGEFFMYATAGLVPLALPLSVLLSSLMTFGNMGEFYELTAIKASGISLQRIMIPVVMLAIMISAAAFFFANNVVPITNLKMRTLRNDMKNLHPEVIINEGVFNKLIEDRTIRVGRKDPATNMLYDIKIYDHSGTRGNLDVTTADSGRMKMTEDKRNMIITLWDGYKYTEVDEGRRRRDRRFPHRMLKFREENIIIAMSGFEMTRSDENIFKSSYQMLNVSQLQRAKDSLKKDIRIGSETFSQNLITSSFFKLNSKATTFGQRYNQVRYARDQKLGSSKQNTTIGAPDPFDPMTVVNPRPTVNQPVTKPKTAEQRRAEARRAASLARRDLANPKPSITDTIAEARRDSIFEAAQKKLKKIDNFDSLYQSLSLANKHRVITDAANNVSSNTYMVLTSTERMDYETRKLRKHEIEWHRKFTLSIACLIFLFIGAPLGAIIRKGGLGLPTVISTLLFIMYYVISLIGQKLVEESILTSFQGMWLSSFILVIAGIFLTYQATNDSAILNIDTYLNWIREKAGLRRGALLEKKMHIAGKFEIIEIPRTQLQDNFREVGDMAGRCLQQLDNDASWLELFKRSFHNTGFFYLLEFGIHYNSFLDQVILSTWFRIPYFEKRLEEFPIINGRITSEFFTLKTYRWIALILFPVALIRVFHLKFKIYRLKRNLRQVIELSTGMINLLNSSAFRNILVTLE